MFGTITADVSAGALNRYLLRYRNLDTGEDAALSIMPLDDDGDPELYVKRKLVGRHFEVTLPPGRYEFYDFWMVAQGLFGASTEWRAKTPFSIPFTIQAGRTHYIGDIRAYPVVGRNLLGGPARGGGYFTIADREAQAQVLLTKRRTANPGAAPVGQIINIVPDPDKAGTPFIRRHPLPPFQAG